MDYFDKKDTDLNSYDPEKSAQFYENLPKEVVELLIKTHPLKGKNREEEEYNSQEEVFESSSDESMENFEEEKIFTRRVRPKEEPLAAQKEEEQSYTRKFRQKETIASASIDDDWEGLEEDHYLYDDDWDSAYDDDDYDEGRGRRKAQFSMPVFSFRIAMILTMCTLVVIIGALVYKNNSLLSQIEELTSQKEVNPSDPSDTMDEAGYQKEIQSLNERITQQEQLIQALQGNTTNESNTNLETNSPNDTIAFKPIEPSQPTVNTGTTQNTTPSTNSSSSQGGGTSAETNTSSSSSNSSNTYTVKSGDTLWQIAGGDKNKVDRIMELNGIEAGDHIYAGQVLTLP